MGCVLGWLFAVLALLKLAMAAASMLAGEDVTAHVACTIACSAMSMVYFDKGDME